MSVVGFLILLLIAAVCGFIGQAISGRGSGGFLFAIVIGFVGAFIGSWLAGALNLPELLPVNIEGRSFPVVWSIVGAALLSLIFGAYHRRRVVSV